MNITLLGIDLAKNIFQLHGVDEKGNNVLSKRIKRKKLIEFIAKISPCTIALEACASANYWARKFECFGHKVKIISSQFVKPYVKSNKNDAHDAAAIAEAASRPHMRTVPIKTIEQQDIQSLHRIRTRLIQNRTALTNQIRGLLAEYGIVIAQGIHHVGQQLPLILEETENELSLLARRFFWDLYEQIKVINKQIETCEKEIESVFQNSQDCQRLAEIPGIGTLTATALVATVGDATLFENGRHLAAWLGLVPKQHSSGNKQKLLGISKRGNNYVRSLLIHGGRSLVLRCQSKTDKRSRWLADKKIRCGTNKAAVAQANKNARIVWSLLVNRQHYKPAVI